MAATRSTCVGRISAVAVASVLLLASCGDDDDEPTASGALEAATEAAATATTAAAVEDASEETSAAFCDAIIEGEALFNVGPDTDEEGNPTPEGLEAFSSQLTPLLDELEANAPESLATDVEAVLGGVRQALETGDTASIETPEFVQADAAVDAFVYDNCDLEHTQEIVATEYAFEVPESLPAGQMGFRLVNQGEEVHEAVMFRIPDDVTQSLEEILQLPEEEAQGLIEFTTATFAEPGSEGYAVVDLEPGRYGMVCFVPVGTRSMEELMAAQAEAPEGEAAATEGSAEEGAGQAPPHMSQGMVAEFEVS